MIKKFIYLTKPGIIFGNLVSVLGGFFLAAQGNIDLWLLLVALVGTSLVVASGCVVNNIIDQDIDYHMERTRNRALVKQTISNQTAFIYAVFLGVIGFALLYVWANLFAVAFAALGYVVYAGLYSLYLKRHSVHQTIIGSISGACPPVIGYCAARHGIDSGALILFVLFCFWQMPHSFAIAIYRLKDYQAANIPILPVKKSIHATKVQSVIYIVLFFISGLALYCFDYVGMIYLIIFCALSAYWLFLAIKGFYATDDQLWAKKFFLFSVILISIFSLTIALDYTHTVHPPYIVSIQ